MFNSLSDFTNSYTQTDKHAGEMTVYYTKLSDRIVSLTTFLDCPLVVPSVNNLNYDIEGDFTVETCWDSTIITYSETDSLETALETCSSFVTM